MRPFLRRLVVPLCLVLFAAPAAWSQGGPGHPIDQGLWRLDGTDPGLPYDDLEPLRRIVGGAQFVALGEAEHTSGGFYEMKHRTFRFLVERMGFRALGWEAPWISADRVAAYVRSCQGTPRTALRALAGVWRSVENEALVRWMCEWNQAHPDDPVHFYGFDVQVQALQNGRALIAFLERLGIGAGDPRVEGIRACDGVVDNWYLFGLSQPPALHEQCQAALADVAAYFDANEKDVERQTSREDLAWTRIHLVGLRAWQDTAFYFESDPLRSFEARDRGMAYAAQAIRDLRFPHARVALWAHNWHIAKNRGAVDVADMGDNLTAALGNRFRSIGLIARETYVDWIFVNRCGLSDIYTGPGSVEHILSGLGPGAGVLADLNAHPPFLTPGATYFLGGLRVIPGNQFDAVIHLDVSPKMTPTSWAPCQP